MILRTASGAQRELRMPAEFGSTTPPAPSAFGSWLSKTGEYVTPERAAGLPAVLNAIRLVAETTGRLPLRVYSGTQAQRRMQEKSWQWRLLHDRPNDERSPFDFWQDVSACVETSGNAYLLKVKDRGQVIRLYLIPPRIVNVRRDIRTGELQYVITQRSDDRREDAQTLTRSEVIHVRGITLDGADVGLSPIAVARDMIGASTARYDYEGEFFRNSASPGGAIKIPENVNREKARQIVAIWKQHHQGVVNAGNPAVLSGGADWQRFGLSLEDAQFIEAHAHSISDVARIFSVPASLLQAKDRKPTEDEARAFLNFGLYARLTRIASALRSDPDLFPDSSLYPEFYAGDFVRGDAMTMADIYHKLTQVGILVPDEPRAELGYQPLPDGKGQIPQITPVGGAPNPPAATGNGTSTNGTQEPATGE